MSESPVAIGKTVESGVLRFDGLLITYTSKHCGSFSIPLSEVAIIGELTTDNGPFADDWFLVLVSRSGGGWFEAPMYAEGCCDLREQLFNTLGSALQVGLANRTDFASRIMWPPTLINRPLFTFSHTKGSSFLRRLKLVVLPEIFYSLSPDALSGI